MTRPGSTCSRSASAAANAPRRRRSAVPASSSVGEQGRIAPHRLAVARANARAAPSAAAARPGYCLPMRVLQRRAGRPERRQPADQPPGVAALGGAERVGVPLRRLHVGGGDEGRLAAHASGARRRPAARGRPARRSARMSCHCALGIRLGDARRFARSARTDMSKSNVDLALLDQRRRSARRIAGRGVAASGICPSPASRPEVASRPIQPAPGR